jgi:hypothetical protein
LIDVGSFYCLVSNEVVIEVSIFIVGKKKGGCCIVFDLWIRILIIADLRDYHSLGICLFECFTIIAGGPKCLPADCELVL